MIYGFVGASKGLTGPQFHALALAVARNHEHTFTFPDVGEGTGAHEQMLYITRAVGVSVELLVADGAPEALVHTRIVDGCNILIACPSGPETPRSPTWTAVRYARMAGRSIVIIAPDGTITKERAGARS